LAIRIPSMRPPIYSRYRARCVWRRLTRRRFVRTFQRSRPSTGRGDRVEQSVLEENFATVQPVLARRAARLAATPPAAESHEAIPFDSGHAFPGVLPDLTAAAQAALTTFRAETLQYGVRPGLPEMREFIAAYMNADGAKVTADEILVVNGAKH